MLSIGAFNALLKTLEEPPEYVIFILATTEVHKIPVTILSRCQHYDFHRITIETITGRMQELLRAEEVEAEEKALRYIAKAADGSMRDALSLLDQCIAFYLGQKLTYEHVLEVLGAVDTDVFSRLLRKVIERNVPEVLDIVEELVMQGRELSQMVTDFTWYLRNLLLVQTSDKIEDVLDVSAENLRQLQEEARMVETDRLLRDIRIFSELSGKMKYATQKRVVLEVALIKLCTPAMEVNPDTLLDRLRVVEAELEKVKATAEQGFFAGGFTDGMQGGFVDGAVVNGAGGANGFLGGSGGFAGGANGFAGGAGAYGGANGFQGGRQARPQLTAAVPEDVEKVVKKFRAIADEVSAPTSNYLKKARLSLSGENRLLIVLPDEMSFSMVNREDHLDELTSAIENYIGKKIEIEVRQVEEGRHFEDTFADLEQFINMEITVED